MTLTAADKINKTLEYCEYTKQLVTNAGNEVRYLVEIENTGGEQQCTESTQIVYIGEHLGTLFYSAVCNAALGAKQYSQTYNCLSSVKVCIMHYNSDWELINEDPIDEYEIFFENGIEVQ